MRMKLWSEAFEDEGPIPVRYTCDGENISPPLAWDGVPKGTKSFAIVMDDLEAHGGLLCHWLLFNLPGDLRSLGEGVPRTERLVHHAGMQGRNDLSIVGYSGPCPPLDGAHRYRFSIYALDTVLDAKPGTTRKHLFDSMEGHYLGFAYLTGIYERERE